MMSSHLDHAPCACLNAITWLHTAIYPCANVSWMYLALFGNAVYGGEMTLYALFNGQSFTCDWIVYKSPCCQALTHGRPRGQNNQIRTLQPPGQAIQVGEASGDADDGAASFVQLVQFVHVFGEDIAQQGKVGAGMAL